jgi:hypothetical protein
MSELGQTLPSCQSSHVRFRQLRTGRNVGADSKGPFPDSCTAKLNAIDPQAWLADVLARLPDYPAKRIHELLPWNWHRQNFAAEAA